MKLHNEDCIIQMQKMIDEGVQVDSVVTDPPYELGFMGKSWDSTGIAFQKETWKLAFQLLKPGGHLLAFSGSRTYHRMAVAIEDAGFEIRDQIMWLYGSGFPKSMNIGKNIDKINRGVRHGTKDNSSEMHGVKREKIEGNTRNDIDTFYRTSVTKKYDFETEEGKKWDGWGTHLKPAHEPVVMARKPVEGTVADNVLKHGTGGINIDECRIELSEGDDPRLGGKGSFKTDKAGKDVYSLGYRGEETTTSELGRFPANVMHDGLEQEWARFFYCPKVSKSERNKGIENNNHPTVKPIELMKYLCRLVTPKGGTVLDPFMGSGSTGMAAKDEGFDFIGIEKEEEYFEISNSRIKSQSPLMEFV